MTAPLKVGQGFQTAPLKAEGRQVLYYQSNGAEVARQQDINEKLRQEVYRMETEAKIRAWAKDSE